MVAIIASTKQGKNSELEKWEGITICTVLNVDDLYGASHGGTCSCFSWAGDFCEQDLDECLVMPCQNGGTCLNSHGSFKCTCQPDTTGYLCQETSFSSIKSTPFNITIEEIIGIAGTAGFHIPRQQNIQNSCCKISLSWSNPDEE